MVKISISLEGGMHYPVYHTHYIDLVFGSEGNMPQEAIQLLMYFRRLFTFLSASICPSVQ